MTDAPPIPSDEVLVIYREVALGLSPEESSLFPMTPARRRVWANAMKETDKMRRRGKLLDLPFDS